MPLLLLCWGKGFQAKNACRDIIIEKMLCKLVQLLEMELWSGGGLVNIRILVKLADVDGERERMKQMQSQRTDGCKHTYMVIYASMKKSIVRNECSTKKGSI